MRPRLRCHDQRTFGVVSAMAVPALLQAAGPDPLDAALQALYAAAVAFGRDDYPALDEEARRAHSL